MKVGGLQKADAKPKVDVPSAAEDLDHSMLTSTPSVSEEVPPSRAAVAIADGAGSSGSLRFQPANEAPAAELVLFEAIRAAMTAAASADAKKKQINVLDGFQSANVAHSAFLASLEAFVAAKSAAAAADAEVKQATDAFVKILRNYHLDDELLLAFGQTYETSLSFHQACKCGDLEAFMENLEKQQKLGLLDQTGSSPSFHAIGADRSDVVKHLPRYQTNPFAVDSVSESLSSSVSSVTPTGESSFRPLYSESSEQLYDGRVMALSRVGRVNMR